jgi:nucleoid-associated protein YgaU
MVLGAIVLSVAAFLVFSYFRNLKVGQTINNGANNNTAQEIYTVSKGDSLWTISEKYYGTGFEWHKIADANAISNSDQIEEGMELSIPTNPTVDQETEPEVKVSEDISVGEAEKQTTPSINSTATENSSYTVTHGDSLWSIAVKSYGDGYKWVEIAKANNLSHPNTIHPGNKLVLPKFN